MLVRPEERHGNVFGVKSQHRSSRYGTMTAGVVPVLDSTTCAVVAMRRLNCDVTRGEDPWIASGAGVVDHDPATDLQADGGSQSSVGSHTDPDDDQVCLQPLTVGEHQTIDGP